MNTSDTEREGFEKYLEHVCFQANPTVLDDDMPDFFDNWLGSQNGEDYIRLADAYASSRDTYWKERVRKEVEGKKVVMVKQCGECNNCESHVSECEYVLEGRAINKTLDTLLDNLK